MKITIVLPFLKAGGTERQASYISNFLGEQGHKVITLCIEKKGIFRKLFNGSVKFLGSKNSIARFPLNLYLLSKFLKQNQTDLIVSRAWNTNMLCGFTSLLINKPVVLFLSGSINLENHNFLKKEIFRFVLKRSTMIISVSDASKNNCVKYLDIPDEKIEVVHNGIDTKWINHQANQKIDFSKNLDSKLETIVFVGSLIHRKGVDILLRAMKKVLKVKKANLIIVGNGEKYSDYLSLCDELNIKKYVAFVGEKSNPFPYLRLGDIFVLSSRAEGFPNVLLEAMALKKAIIATDCETGPREIIDDNNNGTLIPVDSVESLSEAIIKYLLDPKLRSFHANNAFKTITQSYQLNNKLMAIEDLFKKATKHS